MIDRVNNKITIHVTDLKNNTKYSIKKDIQDPCESLCDFISSNESNPILVGYYASREMVIAGTFPYIIRNDSIIWNVNIQDVTIEEFLCTHPFCINNGIKVEVGTPMAGGPGRVIAEAALELFISTITVKYPQIGLSVLTIKKLSEIITYLRDYFIDKDITPKQQLDALVNNEFVSPYVIMEILGYDEYHAQEYLKCLGFYKDNKSRKYKINDIDKSKARLLISFLDDAQK